MVGIEQLDDLYATLYGWQIFVFFLLGQPSEMILVRAQQTLSLLRLEETRPHRRDTVLVMVGLEVIFSGLGRLAEHQYVT
jgi:hypothetical protein